MKQRVNIVYKNVSDAALYLDLFLPDDVAGHCPVIVWIHGGSWFEGSKENCPILFLVDHGYAVASISYRLSTEAVFPAQVLDCRDAIIHLKNHADAYGIDPDRVGVWGESAGGHLAACIGVTNDPDAEYAVHAVCDFCGPVDIYALECEWSRSGINQPTPGSVLLGVPIHESEHLAATINPITYIHSAPYKLPPFLIVHGDQDVNVPIAQSIMLVEALESVGTNVVSHTAEGSGHNISDPAVFQRAVDFFDSILKVKVNSR
ncbi:acetyl esterase/lipase [Paenibacillus cellulosilyticus]|uniref:Acetyl esterase/lipase n=1 Tax=Paenibacillus cellulosilyticus TaxID=375489 RepID=A0A2V2YQT7_9BACL|nr:alpha/beta hydrolase [Paenibacillus cellulosilyticus]PWV99376.1 acetyl esterase/lipase [Paenibacillus cellulosilyticus]QKS45140.1 alpha/beta hydrolase [Paenibacillus cellulosilyticus]